MSTNRIKQLQINNQSIFNTLIYLTELDLEANLIQSINENDFKLVINLKFLNLESNPIQTIDVNPFYSDGSLIYILKLTMLNISVANVNKLRDSFKPKMVKKFFHLKYYSPTHIENRKDIDCVKTLYFMRYKIFYNFFNEHIDIEEFLTHCTQTDSIRRKLNEISELIQPAAPMPLSLGQDDYDLYFIWFGVAIVLAGLGVFSLKIFYKIIFKKNSVSPY